MIETDEAPVRARPTHSELERALVSVPGVEEAHVTLMPETGRSRLRIRLANGEDAPTVSWAIAATLRERFGIVLDPGAIRPRLTVADEPAEDEAAAAPGADEEPADQIADAPAATRDVQAAPADVAADEGTAERTATGEGTGDEPVAEEDAADDAVVVVGDRVMLSEAARAVLSDAIEPDAEPTDVDDHAPDLGAEPWAADPQARGRAAIRHLDTRIDVSDVRVTATLTHGERTATGESRSVPTRKGILRAVAEATVAALCQLTGDRLVVGVDSVAASVAGEPPMANVLVGVISDQGEETLVGASLVRQDPERAVMRATLDALNRRVQPWLEFDLAG